MQEHSWLEPDWRVSRPSAFDPSQSRLMFEPVTLNGEGVRTLVGTLSDRHQNGGAKFASFSCVRGSEDWAWAASRNRFKEFGFLAEFFRSEAVTAALPDLRLSEVTVVDDDFGRSSTDAFDLAGSWAHLVFYGGAYGNFNGTAADAMTLARRALDELVQGRYDEFNTFVSPKALTPWHREVAWDLTWVVVDQRNRLVHLLTVTDTD